MLGMGCTTTIKAVWSYLRRPVGIAIGACCQFILMPLIGFTLAHALRLNANLAIGTLIVACCPGGTLSNLFCYYSDGDITLSICMTTCSTVLAIGMMPLSLFIYSRSWTTQSAVIPYTDIVIALVTILVPAGIGIAIRWKSEKVANITQKVCSTLSMVGILSSVIIQVVTNVDIFLGGVGQWIIAIIYPILAFVVGYGVSSIPLFRLKQPQRRTVGFETGCQNVALALTIINLSFPKGPAMLQMMVIPSLFGVFMVLDSLIFVACFRIYMKVKKRKDDKDVIVVYPEKNVNNNISGQHIDSGKMDNGKTAHVNREVECVERTPAGTTNHAFDPDHPDADTLYEVSTQTPYTEGAHGQWDIVTPRPWKAQCEEHRNSRPDHDNAYTNYALEDDHNNIVKISDVTLTSSMRTIDSSTRPTDSAYTSRSRLNISYFDLSTSYLIKDGNSIWESSI
ncbi:sodium-dependent organic anion transporter-like [Glandiceps talaboti]